MTAPTQGWQCPVCRRVNAPFVPTCGCSTPFYAPQYGALERCLMCGGYHGGSFPGTPGMACPDMRPTCTSEGTK